MGMHRFCVYHFHVHLVFLFLFFIFSLVNWSSIFEGRGAVLCESSDCQESQGQSNFDHQSSKFDNDFDHPYRVENIT